MTDIKEVNFDNGSIVTFRLKPDNLEEVRLQRVNEYVNYNVTNSGEITRIDI